jgi:REP element-mobilizing transposase RayT
VKQKYDPFKHHRRTTRLKGWDYGSPGVYFVTFCTYQRENLFDDKELCELVGNMWQAIPTQPRAQHVTLDEWVVMPNHLHGIIVLIDTDCRGEASGNEAAPRKGTILPDASPNSGQPLGVTPGSLGVIAGNFKSLTTRQINNLRRTPGGRVWQRGYYDRIVRNERELNAVRNYIRENPQRWEEDRDNLDALINRMAE